MTESEAYATADRAALRSEIERLYSAESITGDRGTEFPLIPRGFLEWDGEALRDLAIAEKVVHTVETGLCFALSALFICEALVASGQHEARHVAMDPFQDKRVENAGLGALRAAGVASMVEFHDRGSELVLPELLAEDRAFDLAFIDGDHRFEGAFLDLYYLHRLVKPGGLIVVDDVWMPSVRMAVSYFVKNVGLEIAPSPFRGVPFTGEAASMEQRIRSAPRARIAVLRRPAELPERPWFGHFVPFADADTGMVRSRSGKAMEELARQGVDRLRPLVRRLHRT